MHTKVEIIFLLPGMKHRVGFTLIELAIAMAIVGILSILTVNGYQDSLQKANFRSMRDVASKVALSQQQHRQSFGQYASQLASSGNPSAARLIIPELNEYTITISNANFQGFTARVTPRLSTMQTPERCRILQVSSSQGFLRYDSFSASNQNTTRECLPNG